MKKPLQLLFIFMAIMATYCARPEKKSELEREIEQVIEEAECEATYCVPKN